MRAFPRLLCLLATCWITGCSSPDANYPYSNLKLTEIRQAPGGQLALIFAEKRGQPPGQRVFLTDTRQLALDLSVAQAEISSTFGYGESFAGGVILHRRKALDGLSPDTFWLQLDPYELTGTWAPSLTEPALPAATVAQSLPLESNSSVTVVNPAQFASWPITTTLPDVRFTPAQPNQHFLWQTDTGIFETSVSPQPLIQAGSHNYASKETKQVVGGGILLAAYGGLLALEILDDCHGDHPEHFHRR